MTSTIVFDFDGTLAVGPGPVLAYARAVAECADPELLAEIVEALDTFEEDGSGGFRDGYDVVGTLAQRRGIPAAEVQAAYRRSRAALGTDACPVEAAPGLAVLLGRLPVDTRVILATNAPADGLDRVLAAWGLAGRFDEVLAEVGKPAGLTPIIRRALKDGPVLAVGDIVENDLAPAAAEGAATALVGATWRTSPAPATMRGPSIGDIADEIAAWALSPETPAPSGAATPAER
ncbi:HAD family hydrolase [Microbacterium excoecariae]|uniref:HAD family hydrolase n=1 Tax=Microbacterium excoecariae TaxID=2715210 RepID=UPI0030B8F865|nr:HAD family hydrolase [Microbacterium excoecariae]